MPKKKIASGRPAGSKTVKLPPVTGEKTRCQACSSTEREPYWATIEHPIDGVKDGKPYTHVVWRRTKCRNCGQHRQDRFFENRPGRRRPAA